MLIAVLECKIECIKTGVKFLIKLNGLTFDNSF